MGQYHGVGESHYRTATLHNDVLPRLRDNSLRPDTDRGLFRDIERKLGSKPRLQRKENGKLVFG